MIKISLRLIMHMLPTPLFWIIVVVIARVGG